MFVVIGCSHVHAVSTGMAVFLRNITFHGILLDALFEPGNPDWRTVHDLVSNGIRDGTVRPLEATVFERDDIEAAFRFMAHGKHVGKVLVKVTCLRLLASVVPTILIYLSLF